MVRTGTIWIGRKNYRLGGSFFMPENAGICSLKLLMGNLKIGTKNY
jgi:hypothetical protein